MKLFSTLAIAGLVFLTVACNDAAQTAAVATYSCNIPTSGMCIDFDADYGAMLATVADSTCTPLSGTVSATAACSATSRVGHCAVTANNYTNTYSYYSGGDVPFTAESAAAACTASSGTFTPSSVDDSFDAEASSQDSEDADL